MPLIIAQHILNVGYNIETEDGLDPVRGSLVDGPARISRPLAQQTLTNILANMADTRWRFG